MWTQSDSPDLAEFLDRIKPPSPKMRRLKTAPEKLAPAPAEAPRRHPPGSCPARRRRPPTFSDNQKRRVLTAIEDDPPFDEAVVAELRPSTPQNYRGGGACARDRSAPSSSATGRAPTNSGVEPALHAGIARTLQDDWRERDEARGVEATPQARVDQASDRGGAWRPSNAGPRSKRSAAAAPERRQKPFLVFAAGVLYAASLRRKFWLLKATDDASAAARGALKTPGSGGTTSCGTAGRGCGGARARLAAAPRRAQAARSQRRAAPEDAPARGPGAARDAGLRGQALLWLRIACKRPFALRRTRAARRQVCRSVARTEASARRRLADRALERQKRSAGGRSTSRSARAPRAQAGFP